MANYMTISDADTAVYTERALRTITIWFAVLAVLILLLVIWGTMVRVTGSGLSIPDWPMINGSLMHPTSPETWQAALQDYREEALRLKKHGFPADITFERFKSLFWIEYMHRTLAALVGVIFLVILFLALKNKTFRSKISLHLAGLGILLFIQAVMGGLVVIGALQAAMVAIHLGLAFIFFSWVVWTAFILHRKPAAGAESRSAGLTAIQITISIILLLFLQVILGGLLAGNGGGQAFNTWPTLAGRLIPPASFLWNSGYDNPMQNFVYNIALIQFIHRWLAFVILGLFIYLFIITKQIPVQAGAKKALKHTMILLGLQIVLGIINLITSAQAHISIGHTGLGLLLFGSLVYMLHEFRYGFHKVDE